jgi:methyl-accepting chemotaxis protein
MENFLNFKTRGKMIIGFVVIVIATILFSVISYTNHRRMSNVVEENSLLDTLAYELTGLRADENRLRALSLEALFYPERLKSSDIQTKIEQKQLDILQKTKGLDSLLKAYPDQMILMNELEADVKKYVSNREKMLTLITEGETESAMKLVNEEQDILYEQIRSKSIQIETNLLSMKDKTHALSQKAERIVVLQLFILGSILVILVISIAIWTLRIVRKISEEIKSGVEILGTASADILSAVTEISAGAAETATAVTETTTTIEEVRQTAMVSNQKAQSLMESSQKASDSADKGRDSVKKLTSAIQHIDSQMHLISDTVVKLSEQNRAIADITSTVADIADQSNLLAVNAAIEAAKAGEHGRGFTIVAQEIRSLADQSKRATQQVKEILNEINKSVNSTVGVTDQGAKSVDEGIRRVKESGEVIDILADNVEDAVEAAIQISSSTRQQMAGMDQIVPAMENIKRASEQNVTGINHTQDTAQKIHQLGRNLKLILIKYNL